MCVYTEGVTDRIALIMIKQNENDDKVAKIHCPAATCVYTVARSIIVIAFLMADFVLAVATCIIGTPTQLAQLTSVLGSKVAVVESTTISILSSLSLDQLTL